MATKSMTIRLARGSFGTALMAFLGPGFHFTSNPRAPRAEIAFEAGVLGLVIGAAAITLAIVALRRFRRESDKAGVGWARSALAIAGVSIVVWVAALALGRRA